MQTYVVPPAEPGVAFKDVAHFVKSCDRFLIVSGVRVIDSQVDQRIRFRLQHMVLVADLQSFLIKFESACEILQLTMNPSNAIRNARVPEQITVAPGHPHGLVQNSRASDICPRFAFDSPRKNIEVRSKNPSRNSDASWRPSISTSSARL